MDPALLELIAAGAPGDEVAVIVRLKKDCRPPPGLRAVARFGTIATARVQRGRIAAVYDHPDICSLKAPRVYSWERTEADEDEPGVSEADPDPVPSDLRRAPDLPETGRGTVVCIIDWGFDFAHPDFRRPDGSTRLLALWDQRGEGQAHPYGYGNIHRSGTIDRALGTHNPFTALGYQPTNDGRPAHGTHVAGIAAGNGRAGGPAGVAPEADLIFVHLGPGSGDLGNSIDLLEAVHFAAAEAQDRGLAINLSIGRHAGPHDGTLLIERAIDWLVVNRPGTVIVQSTGNYFDRRVHMQGRLRETRVATLPFNVPRLQGSLPTVEVWYKGADRFTVAVIAPDGSRVQVERGGNEPVAGPHGREYARLYHRAFDPNNGDHLIALVLRPGAPLGLWTIELTGQDVVDGRWHAWIERNASCPRCQAQFQPGAASSSTTTGSICNALRTIAVGAYDPHGDEVGLARFSSDGPTRDGRPKPLLVAPGVRVLSVRSRSDPSEVPGYVRMSGTSMAAPHVTGAAALMLQAAGRQPIEVIRRTLFAALDPAPGESSRWGYGLLNTEAAVAGARRLDSVRAPDRPLRPTAPVSADQIPEDTVIMADDPEDVATPPSRPPADRLWTKGRDQTLPTPEQRVLARFSDDELRAMLGEPNPNVAVAMREDLARESPEALLALATDPQDVTMQVIGWPGRRLATPMAAGDVLIHQPIAGRMQSAIVVDGVLHSPADLGLPDDPRPVPGRYVRVAGPSAPWRIAGPDALLLDDLIVLRGTARADAGRGEWDTEALPSPADIGRNLDAITIRTRQRNLPSQPNFIALNEVASFNTPEKRERFGSLRTALDTLRQKQAALDAKVAAGGGVPTAPQQRAIDRARQAMEAAQRQVDRSAAALTDWVRAEGPSHNRRRRAIAQSLTEARAELRRARARGNAGAATAAEQRVQTLEGERDAHAQWLRDRIAAFDPIVDITQNQHEVVVDGITVDLDDNVVTYATDNPLGLEGRMRGDDRAAVTAAVAASGLGADSRAILNIVSRHEGFFSSVNSWDRALVTFGFIQWTFGEGGNGSLVGLLANFRRRDPAAFQDRYERYGISLSGDEVELLQRDGTRLTGGAAAQAIRTDVKLMAVFARAGAHAGFQAAQVAHAHDRKIVAMRAMRIPDHPVSVGDVVSSQFGVGVMTDRAVHSGERAVRRAIKRALDRFVAANTSANLAQSVWQARAEPAATEALVAIDRRRAASFAALDHARGSFTA